MMFFKCAPTFLVAALCLHAVLGAQMSEDDHAAEIARLQKMLEEGQKMLQGHKEAVATIRGEPLMTVRDRRASAQAPQFKTVQGNLEFQVKDGKRIGYKIGTADTVNFDTLAKTDQQLGLLIQSVHKSGEATGEHAAAIEHLKANMSVAVFDAKLGSAVGPLDTRVTSVEDKLKTVGPLDARVKSVEDKLKTMATAATAAAQKKETSYWYDMFVDAGENAGVTLVGPGQPAIISITGAGFEERYNPHAGQQMKCELNDGKTKKTVLGSVVQHTGYFVVQCPVPGYPKGATVEVSLYEHSGTKVPFLGASGNDKFKCSPRFTKVTLTSNFPKKSTYMVEGAFEKGKSYKCTFKGDVGESSTTVNAQSTTTLNCGEGPTKVISKDFSTDRGTCTLVITQGSDNVPGSAAKTVTYYVCAGQGTSAADYLVDCVSGCPIADNGGQAVYTSPGTYVWTSPACGSVSVVAVGGGGGGGWQWSSGGGGGGGLGYIKKYRVEKGKTYTIVVGKGGPCVPNAGNTHAADGGTSYFVSTSVVAGYGGGKGGPKASSSAAGYGGGYKGDGGGRGGRGGRGSWTGGGGGAAGYKGHGGDSTGNRCNGGGNNGCQPQSGSGGGGGAGYYSSSHGTPGGGGVGLIGHGSDGRGDWKYGGTGGSGGTAGSHGEPYSNGVPRCSRYGGKYGGGGPGSGSSRAAGSGGYGAVGAVRIIWGTQRQYPAGAGNV